MIKKTFFFSGIIIWLAILYLAYINKSVSLSINYIKGSIDLGLPVFVISIVIFSVLATILVMQANISYLEQKFKQQSRKTEKASIVKEEAQDKVKLLEAKIQTLEKALSDALKRN